MNTLTHSPSLRFFCCVLLGMALHAGDASADGGRIPFRHYSIPEGLPHENVKTLAQTVDGRLWIGTSAGLSVFNGITFDDVVFEGLSSAASVYEIEALPDGSLWVATESRGVWLVQGDQAVQPFPALAGEHIHRFVAWQDTLYMFGTEKVWKLDMGTQQLTNARYRYAIGTPEGSGIVSADIASDGTVWVLDGRLGPGRVTADGTVQFHADLARMEVRSWRFLRFDMYGTGWVTHQREGLYRLAADGTLELVLQANGAEHICVTPDRIAVASGRLGGLMWDLQKQAPLAPLNEQSGMPTNRINCLFRDKEGNTWIGTQDGLIQLVNPGVEHVMESAGQPLVELQGVSTAADGSIWTLSRSEGLVRVAPRPATFQPGDDARWTALINGQDDALYAIERRAWYKYAADAAWQRVGALDNAVSGVVDANGVGFFKRVDGLYRYEADGEEDMLLGWMPGEGVYYEPALTPDGRLIVWENGRLIDIDKQRSPDTGIRAMQVLAEYPALRGVGVRALTMDSDRRIWVSLQGRGLFCIQDGNVLFLLPDLEIDRLTQLNDSLMAVEAHDGLHAYTFR
ncbi:MAG: two-component regulator propeller domain-containing protein, partial [Rhodothermales bacterium]